MTVSEWRKIENDGDPWQPTCWLRMAHKDDDEAYISEVGVCFMVSMHSLNEGCTWQSDKMEEEEETLVAKLVE